MTSQDVPRDIIGILNADDPLIPRAQIGALLGPPGKPVTPRTVSRYMAEPDGLAHVEIGGRVYSRLSAIREFVLKRERKPNPRRPEVRP